MKILFDHLCFWEKYGGVSRYFVKLINNMPSEVQYDITVRYTNNEYINELSLANIKKVFDNISFRGKARLISALNKPYSISSLKKGNYDIYHQTHYNPYGYKYLPKNKKSVMTIYDMNFFVIPEEYKKNYFQKSIMKWQKKSSEIVDKIITISENTKNDLIKLWNISETKIDVVYLGVDNIILDIYDKRRLYPNPYILFVGQRSSYKNFKKFLKAFNILIQTNHDLILVCTGNPFSKNEKEMLYQMRLSDKVIHVSASDVEMVGLYYNAELFVYPSLYEGFGMPLLEAMVCNCPVVCSNTSCFPEIASDAACYFNPYSEEDMLDIINKVINSKQLREELKKKGRKRAELFSWEKCANKHIALYKKLYES